MSDLRIGQTQVFTVESSDGSAVSGIAVGVSDPTRVSITITGDASFTVTALAEGTPGFEVTAPGFKPAAPFTLNILAMPTLIVVPGEITGP
jgi:hypothetical protein